MTSNEAMLQSQDFVPDGKIIGLGMRGPIYLCRNTKTNKQYAMKIINKFNDAKRQDLGEAPGLFRFQELYLHFFLKQRPNILQLTEAFLDDLRIYVFTEYAALGTLENYVRRFGGLTELDACRLFQQLMIGIHECHKQSIWHRDISPSNILLDKNGQLLISDFTNAMICPMSASVASNTYSLTPRRIPYTAPEIISKRVYIGTAADIWSCGVVLYYMTHFCIPFDHPNPEITKDLIVNAVMESKSSLSFELRFLLKKILQKDPFERYELGAIIEDPWFQSLPLHYMFKNQRPLLKLPKANPIKLHKTTSFDSFRQKNQSWNHSSVWKIKGFQNLSFIQANNSSSSKKRCWSAGKYLNLKASPLSNPETPTNNCMEQSKYTALKCRLKNWLISVTPSIVQARKNKNLLKFSKSKLQKKFKTFFSSISTSSFPMQASASVNSHGTEDKVTSDSVSSVGSSTLSPSSPHPSSIFSPEMKSGFMPFNFLKKKKFRFFQKSNATSTLSPTTSNASTPSLKSTVANQSNNLINASSSSESSPKIKYLFNLFKPKST